MAHIPEKNSTTLKNNKTIQKWICEEEYEVGQWPRMFLITNTY
jgi:hypothetical protein